MKAYCIVYEIVDDPTMFDEYRRQVLPTIEAHQGRFLVRGGAFTALEGEMPSRPHVETQDAPLGLYLAGNAR